MRFALLFVIPFITDGCSAPLGAASSGSLWDPREHTASPPLAPTTQDPQEQEETTPPEREPQGEVNPGSFGFAVGVRVRGSESALNLSGSYEYRLSDRVRVGGIANYTASPFDTLLIAPAM